MGKDVDRARDTPSLPLQTDEVSSLAPSSQLLVFSLVLNMWRTWLGDTVELEDVCLENKHSIIYRSIVRIQNIGVFKCETHSKRIISADNYRNINIINNNNKKIVSLRAFTIFNSI